MIESPIVLVCLAIISVCVVVMTATIFITAKDLRKTLHRLNSVLTRADRSLGELEKSLKFVRQFVGKATGLYRSFENVAHRAFEAASNALGHLEKLKNGVGRTIKNLVRNGARAEPRFNGRRQ